MALIRFSQGQEIAKVSKNAKDNEGACWALSLQWLKLALNGKSDAQQARISTLRTKKNMVAAVQLQRHYHEMMEKVRDTEEMNRQKGGVKIVNMVRLFVAKMGLAVDMGKETEIGLATTGKGERISAIAKRVCTAGSGHVLYFQSAASGHAMATRARSSGFWHTFGRAIFLFDPNCGELPMSQNELDKFLREYLRSEKIKSLVIVKVKALGKAAK